MSIGLLVFLGLLVLTVGWAVVVYNGLIVMRNRYRNAFSQIDVQLKRRYDLIPNLVNATRAYLTHERETLEAVVAARRHAMSVEQAARQAPGSDAALAAMDSAETALTGSLGRLFALAESYPELKADETVARLSEELSSTENRIAFARQAYNDQIERYNSAVEALPAALIAGLTGFNRAAQLQSTQNAQERERIVATF